MALKIYTITSSYSDVPLAEVRSDGKSVEFVVDNTDNELTVLADNSFKRLTEIISRSSHLSMRQSKGVTAHLLRYVLSSGDVVEVTTDAKTCLINGELLSADERAALFESLRTGELQVAHRSDISSPIPVIPIPESTARIVTKPTAPPKINTKLIDELLKEQHRRYKDMNSGNHYYDEHIENIDFSDAPSPEMMRQLAYLLIYGKVKGEAPDG